MLKQKLLTIAGVLGILACGACFLPPIHMRPPAPLTPALAGIHTIRVVVTETTSPVHLDVEQIASAVVREVNDEAARSGLRAGTGNEPADAVLDIAITNESASQLTVNGSPVANSWHYEFTWTATLTTPDGAIRWQDRNQPTQFTHRFPGVSPRDVWNDRAVRREASDMLRVRICPSLLYGIK